MPVNDYLTCFNRQTYVLPLAVVLLALGLAPYVSGYLTHKRLATSAIGRAESDNPAPPHVNPCLRDIDELEPRIYRPFRPGPYNITMGIRKMPWDEWIEVDQLYFQYHAIRTQRIRTRGQRVAQCLPSRTGLVNGADKAAQELAQELAYFLCNRYPKIFSVCYEGEEGPSSVVQVTITPLGITYDLRQEDPIKIVAQLTQDDFAILIEGTDGKFYFMGGAILVAGSWRLDEKLGMSLDEIHTSGNVPQYEQKLQPSLSKFFRRLTVDTPYARNNYSFQVVDRTSPDLIDPDELAWCSTTNGPEDAEPPKCPASLPMGSVSPTSILFRVERQTLRRLPQTRAIVFSIRTYLIPLPELVREPDVPERLASAIRGWGSDIWEYKKGNLYGEELLRYLDELAKISSPK